MILLPFLFSSVLALPINNTCTPGNRIYDCTMGLVCNAEGFCELCKENNDCDDGYYCKYSKKEKVNVCSYEPLVHSWNWRLIVGMVVLFIAGIFVSGAGIGGGGLFVPIMMLIIPFPAEYSISSSNPIILGGSLAVSLFNMRIRHPDYDRPLINYNIASIIEPISWLGTIIGVIINGVIPDWLLYLIQFILLGYTAVVTFKKGYVEWKKKRAAKKPVELEELDQPLNENQEEGQNPTDAKVLKRKVQKDTTNLSKSVDKPEFKDPGTKEGENSSNNNDKKEDDEDEETNKEENPSFIDPEAKSAAEQPHAEEEAPAKATTVADNLETPLNQDAGENDPENLEAPKKAYSPWVLVILAIIWVIFVIIPFIRGGKNTDSWVGIKFCSTIYWIITFAPFPVYMVISYFMIRIAKHYPVIGADANLSAMQIFRLCLYGTIAGICSGFLGIGGGMIKGPMLLSLGVEAEEMAATSSFLILLTSSITSIQFIANGTMLYSEFGIYVALGFVSFLIGIFLLKILIQKTNNRSLVLWVLAGAIAVSAILMSYVGLDEVIKGIKQHKKMGFRQYCVY